MIELQVLLVYNGKNLGIVNGEMALHLQEALSDLSNDSMMYVNGCPLIVSTDTVDGRAEIIRKFIRLAQVNVVFDKDESGTH